MNLMKNKKAAYIITGQWAKKAYQEAKIYGDAVAVASSADKTFSYIPDCSDLDIPEDADYVYICENNTIYGTKFKTLPNTKGHTLVADVSSCFLSEPVDVTKYGVIYGGIALDFSANVSPLGTPRSVTDAIERALPELYRYPDPYCRTLVQTISEYEGVPKNFVLCGNGASELIYAYCGAVRPKRAMELAPTFSEYSLALRRTGCEVVRFALKQEENFDLRKDFLPFLAREKIDALFLCNPNNPTGRLIADDLLEEILRICREKNIALFVDECFLSLSDGGVDLTPSLSDFPQLFILKAFTKSFGMAGLRLGYGLSADEALLRKMSAAVPPWNVSTLAQAAGVAALGDAEFLEKNRTIIRAERPWLEEKLRKFGFWVCPSQVNYILFRGDVGLTEQLRARGVAIRDCANFEGLTSGWYRVAVRQYEENEQLIAAIGSVGKE